MISELEQNKSGGPKGARSSRPGWIRFGTFSALLVVALASLTFASRRVEHPAKFPFDARPIKALQKQRPDFVLIGNSMVGTRFDEAVLRRLLQPRRVTVLGLSGTMSSSWYAALKNWVVASGQHPRLIIFFRLQELTSPRLWVVGLKGHQRLERISLPEEPVIERKLAPPLDEPMARFEWLRDREVPLGLLREKTDPVAEYVGELGSRLASPTAIDARVRTKKINELFSLSNLRGADDPSEPAEVAPVQVFEKQVDHSFLPDILELAAANQIPLTFVRVRTIEAANGIAETPAELRYQASLERYLNAHGAEFYDTRGEAWESSDMYGTGDHIAGRYRRKYTELFVEHMGRIFH